MGKATNPRRPGNRSSGGRPAQEGDRYPSGKLKKQGPNALMVERRKAMCDDVTKASCPLDVAFANGWISTAEYHAGQTYIEVHRAACLGSPGGSSQADLSVPEPVDVRRVSWSEMSDEEIGRIWDRVMRTSGETAAEVAERRMVEAMILYKALNAAMTPEQRAEVDTICVRESWPQWIIQRINGRTGTSWERKYDLLVAGLRAIRGALAKPKPQNDNAVLTPTPEPANDTPSGPKVIERTVYVDDDGETVLEVERIKRRPAA